MLRIIIILTLMGPLISLTPAPRLQPVTKLILMKGMKFVPSKMEVNIGDTVIWKNESGGNHNVIANDGSFKSDMLEKDQIYALVFEKKGSYKYFCQPHRIMGMKGIIDVK